MKILLLLVLVTGLLQCSHAQDTTWLDKGYQARTAAEKIRCFTLSIREEGPSDEAFYSRAGAYLEAGNFNAAIDDYTRIIETDSTDAGYYYSRGFARHFYTRDYQGALADYTRATVIDSTNAYYLVLAAFVNSILEDYPRAIPCYRRAITALTDGKTSMINLGAITMARTVMPSEKDPEAMAKVNICNFMPTNLGDTRVGLAAALLFSGDTAAAREALQQANLEKQFLRNRIRWFRPCSTDPGANDKNDKALLNLVEQLN